MDIVGVVLAGGKSSRYGKQKIFETYKGISFYEHSIQAFTQGGIPSVYIVTNHDLSVSLSAPGATLIKEETKYEGPLMAIATAMRTLREADWIFLLPADVPYVRPAFIQTMISLVTRSTEPFDAFIPVTGEKRQPLHGVYHCRSLSLIETLLEQNEKSMKPLIEGLHVCFQTFPKNQPDFTNINNKEDWLFP